MATKAVRSTKSTGGAGTIYEYRVAAIALARLLCGKHMLGLPTPVSLVALQQRIRGHLLDDIVVSTSTGVTIEFQVKLTLKVRASDVPFVDFAIQALQQLAERSDDVEAGNLELGLIASGNPAPLGELAELTRWAYSHATHQAFAEYMTRDAIDEKFRTRLDHVKASVDKAILAGAPDLGGAEFTTHRLLHYLRVWHVTADEAGRDYLDTLDLLQPFAETCGATAGTVFEHLASVAQAHGPHGGTIDRSMIERQLRRRLQPQVPVEFEAGYGDIDVEAVVRGPIEALNLGRAVEDAEALLAAKDIGAAAAFDDMADRLDAVHFLPYAIVMRRRSADALQAAGYHDEAALARISLAWDELDRVRIWEAGFVLQDGRRTGGQLSLSDEVQRLHRNIDLAISLAKGADIELFADAFDHPVADDRFAARAAAFLCEEAIADGDVSVLRTRVDPLRQIADAAAATRDDRQRQLALRIRMCLADATDTWSALASDVHHQPPISAAWLCARYGRHLALNGDGAAAQMQYRNAIERATRAKMFNDAADWLYALRTVHHWYDIRLDEQHPRAQVMRPHAKPSPLPGGTHTVELALTAMLDPAKPQEALHRVSRWRWQAVIRAQLTYELNACEALGTLLERSGAVEAALPQFVRAGTEERALKACNALPERPVTLDRAMPMRDPARRAAAYRTVAAAADLVTDIDLRAWTTLAAVEVAGDPADWHIVGPDPSSKAWQLVAVGCTLLPEDQRRQLLARAEAQLNRPAGTHMVNDEHIAEIVAQLAMDMPAAVELMCRAIVTNDRMADVILGHVEVLEKHRDEIARHLEPYADTDEAACQAIIGAGADPALTTNLAKSKIKPVIAPVSAGQPRPQWSAGARHMAVLASVLDQPTRNQFAATMLDRALDSSEWIVTRFNSLAGVLLIARFLDPTAQASHRSTLIELADAAYLAETDPQESGPLLAPLALDCAAALNPDTDQCAQVETHAFERLQQADDLDQWRYAHALQRLPFSQSRLDIQTCSIHPAAALRALAGIRWAQDGADLSPARLRALVHDRDYRVRREFARTLRESTRPPADDLRAVLAADVRRCIRDLARET
jgi:hypothetical protein